MDITTYHLRLLDITTLLLLCLILNNHITMAQDPCAIINSGYTTLYTGDILQCNISDSSDYAQIPPETEALWILYPVNHSIRFTSADFLPAMPQLKILITDVTYLNETDFEPGAFGNSDMLLLETYVIVRDLTVEQNQNTAFQLLDNTFVGLGQIKHLYLESLGILQIQRNAFRDLDSLETLSLNQNYITNLFSNTFLHTPNLISLSMHDNYIENLHNDSLRGLTNLTRLYLSVNSFRELKAGPFQHLDNLEILDLSNNDIASMEYGAFDGLRKLHYLTLNSNELTFFEADRFKDLGFLETLILDRNAVQLQTYLFVNLFSLRHLSIRNNGITQLHPYHFRGLYNLQELFFANNLLTSIPNDTFLFLDNLTVLNLDDNEIETIEPHAFRGLEELEKLSLVGNKFSSLPENVFTPFLNLTMIYIYDNPLVCDCENYWLILWIRERFDSLEPVEQWSYIVCGSNDAINFETFFELIKVEHLMDDLCTSRPTTIETLLTTYHNDMETTEIPELVKTTVEIQTTSAESTILSTSQSALIPSSTNSVSSISTLLSTTNGGKADNQDGGLSNNDVIIIIIACIAVVLVILFVLILCCVICRRQKLNRSWDPMDKYQARNQNDLQNNANTQVPSFFPDPEQTHGTAAWDVNEDDTGSNTSDVIATAIVPNGNLKVQHAYLNHAMATDSTDTLSDFRARKNSMQSAQSAYSYEGEYYGEGYDQAGDNRGENTVSMTPTGRVRTIGGASLERENNKHHVTDNSTSGESASKVQLHFGDDGGGKVQYADIRNSAANDTQTLPHKSSSAESDKLFSGGAHNGDIIYENNNKKEPAYSLLSTRDSTSPETSASDYTEMNPMIDINANNKAKPGLSYIELEHNDESAVENEHNSKTGNGIGGKGSEGVNMTSFPEFDETKSINDVAL